MVRWRWQPDTVALLLLSLVSLGISLKFAFELPPLWGSDERAHAGYALEVMHGHLPRIDTPVVDDPQRYPQLHDALRGWKTVGRQIWVANHPPLYYLVAAPFLAVADWLGVPGAGLVAMRVINGLGTAGGVFLVGLVARELVPGRRAVSLLAAALAATASTLSMEGGYGYNDGLAAVAAAGTLLCGIRLLRRGPSRGLLIATALTATAAAGLKAPNLIAVAACTGMAAVAGWRHSTGRRRMLAALGAAAVAGGVPALGFGWFYLRNLALYGDLTGANELLGAFQRHAHYTFAGLAGSRGFYRQLFEEFWIRPHYDPHLRAIPDALFLGAALGVLLLAVDWLRRRPRQQAVSGAEPGQRATCGDGPDRPAVAGWRGSWVAWAALAAHTVLIVVLLIQFRASGGYISQRYLLPVVPLMATLLAIGLLRLAALVPHPDRARWDAVVALLVSTAMLVVPFVAYHASLVSVQRSVKPPGLADPAVGWPGPALALGLAALAAVGFVLLQARRLVIDPLAGDSVVEATDSKRAHRPEGDAPVEADGEDQLSDDMSSAPVQVNSGSVE